MTEVTTKQTNDGEGLLTVDQVAERLSVKPSWVYANADRLGVLAVGKYRRFLWSRVLERLRTVGKREERVV